MAMTPEAWARLWPHRTHESNWLKSLLCSVGLHRWHEVHVGDVGPARFCRWCSKVQA